MTKKNRIGGFNEIRNKFIFFNDYILKMFMYLKK